MKKLVIAIIVIIALSSTYAEIYPSVAIVVEIDYTNNTFTVMDFNKNLWILTDYEDWMIGDMCALIFWDNNTPSIYDDVILSYSYEGWIEQWFQYSRGE